MQKAVFGACLLLWAGMPLAFGESGGRVVAGDHVKTSQGDLVIHPMKHATFALAWNGRTIFVDPVAGLQMRYNELPMADLILITGTGKDHLDLDVIKSLVGKHTRIVAPLGVERELPQDLQAKTTVLASGESTEAFGIAVDSVPGQGAAAGGEQPRGNSYVLGFGGKKLYVSGDLADPTSLEHLQGIDIAFVDFNRPPATTPESVAKAIKALHPQIVYPYDYGRADPVAFRGLIGWDSPIQVRIRAWY